MDRLRIRHATGADLDAIKDILSTTGLGNDDVTGHLSHFLIAEIEGEIVGTIGLELYGTSGILRSAAVLLKHQGSGIGDQLVSALVGEARTQGVEDLLLLTTTAENYFQRRGFQPIKRETVTGEVLNSMQFRGACPTSAVVMRRRI